MFTFLMEGNKCLHFSGSEQMFTFLMKGNKLKVIKEVAAINLNK